jgi:hypothetical protein
VFVGSNSRRPQFSADFRSSQLERRRLVLVKPRIVGVCSDLRSGVLPGSSGCLGCVRGEVDAQPHGRHRPFSHKAAEASQSARTAMSQRVSPRFNRRLGRGDQSGPIRGQISTRPTVLCVAGSRRASDLGSPSTNDARVVGSEGQYRPIRKNATKAGRCGLLPQDRRQLPGLGFRTARRFGADGQARRDCRPGWPAAQRGGVRLDAGGQTNTSLAPVGGRDPLMPRAQSHPVTCGAFVARPKPCRQPPALGSVSLMTANTSPSRRHGLLRPGDSRELFGPKKTSLPEAADGNSIGLSHTPWISLTINPPVAGSNTTVRRAPPAEQARPNSGCRGDATFMRARQAPLESISRSPVSRRSGQPPIDIHRQFHVPELEDSPNTPPASLWSSD